jgi:hypothetical protein
MIGEDSLIKKRKRKMKFKSPLVVGLITSYKQLNQKAYP